MAVSQIRGGVPEGLRVGDGSARRDRTLFPVLQSRAAAPESGLPDAGCGLPGWVTSMGGAKKRRKRASVESGTLSPNPWDLTLCSQNVWVTLGGTRTEDRAPQVCDSSAGSRAGMARGGFDAEAAPKLQTRPRRILAYCGQKMVLTMGSTSLLVEAFTGQRDVVRVRMLDFAPHPRPQRSDQAPGAQHIGEGVIAGVVQFEADLAGDIEPDGNFFLLARGWIVPGQTLQNIAAQEVAEQIGLGSFRNVLQIVDLAAAQSFDHELTVVFEGSKVHSIFRCCAGSAREAAAATPAPEGRSHPVPAGAV